MTWNYEIDKDTALGLRDAIESEDSSLILKFIKNIYEHIDEIVPEDIISEEELWDYIDEIDDCLDTIEISAMDDDEIEETVNYQLSNLYDLCDNLGIWLPIEE